MIINTNMAALNANRMANVNAGNAAKAMKQLSSGLRINSAADDAAGLAISTKMQGQINGLNQATTNSQTGVSLLQTAEGALTETTSQLQRMRELAVQSANDTNTTADRAAMQTESTQIADQIDNIANTTQFNTKNLLNGDSGLNATIDAGTGLTAISGGSAASGSFSVASVNAGKTAEVIIGSAGTGAGKALIDGDVSTGSFQINGTTVAVTTASVAGLVNAINGQTTSTGVTASLDANSNLQLTNTQVGSNAQIKITNASNVLTLGAGHANYKDVTGGGASGAMLATETAAGTDAVATGTGLGGTATITGTGNTLTVSGGTFNGMEFSVNASIAGGAGNVVVNSNNSLTMQIGANAGQTMSMSINDMSSSALGVNNLDMTTQTGAESAITSIDAATATVSTQQASLGAMENRLTSTITNLGTTSQNLTAASSQITDVDMAATMAEYSKDNVEAQAAQAMIAQANQQPSQVLSLLR